MLVCGLHDCFLLLSNPHLQLQNGLSVQHLGPEEKRKISTTVGCVSMKNINDPQRIKSYICVASLTSFHLAQSSSQTSKCSPPAAPLHNHKYWYSLQRGHKYYWWSVLVVCVCSVCTLWKCNYCLKCVWKATLHYWSVCMDPSCRRSTRTHTPITLPQCGNEAS